MYSSYSFNDKKNIYMAIFELIWSKNINQNSNQDINTSFWLV